MGLFVTGFTYTAAWRLHAERGQAYVLLAFLFACWLTVTLDPNGDGSIDLPAMMHCPNSLTVSSPAGVEHIDASYEGNGLRFEIDEVHRCLREGHTESTVVPLHESIALATTLDTIRAQLGVVYPGE